MVVGLCIFSGFAVEMEVIHIVLELIHTSCLSYPTSRLVSTKEKSHYRDSIYSHPAYPIIL